MFGIDRDRSVEQLYHTSWTFMDGVPGEVHALAQTTDGYLWLGTASGLFRFDGIRFQPYEPSSGQAFSQRNVFSLLAVPDGGLWVGFWYGGVSFLKDGKVTNYSEQDGLPSHAVLGFERDLEGMIWVAGKDGLARLEGSRWRKIGTDWNFAGAASSILLDHKGTLWVGTPESIFFLTQGTKKFQMAADHLKNVSKLAEAPDDTLWMAETRRAVRPVPLAAKDPKKAAPEIIMGSQAIAFDDEGSLWIASLGDGIRRVPYPGRLEGSRIEKFDPKLEAFTQEQGLTGNFVFCTLRDREGNIWIGTSVGLDRFRQSALTPVSFPAGSVISAMVAGDQRTVWAASLHQQHGTGAVGTSRPFAMIQRGRFVSPERSLLNIVDCAYRDPDGVIWIGTHTQLLRFGDERLHPVDALKERVKYESRLGADYGAGLKVRVIDLPKHPEATITPETRPRALTKDASGRLWVSISGKGVYRLESFAWTSLESLGGPRGSAISEFTDADGRVWFGFANNTVAMLDGDTVRTFSSRDGLVVGSVLSLQGEGHNIWVGGDTGLALFEGSRFRPIAPADGGTFGGVTGNIATPAEGLWLAENRGVVHIPESELRLFHRDSAHRVTFEAFGLLDGLPAQLQRTHASASVIEATDGVLWFATTQGLVWIDPNRIPRNAIPPPVAIQSISADGKRYSSSEPLTLPAGTENLQFVYAGLSLSVPERVRFRYKLEGQDKDWQDAGTRREAFYTNLAPGAYRFHLVACNNDGVWNDEGATFGFGITPAWYQTIWFLILCIAISILMVWALHRIRVRQVARALGARFDERLDERTRLARELHDTLLQTIQGSKMLADDALDSSTDAGRMRRVMERLSECLGQATREGREALRSLRVSTTERNDLTEALRRVAEDCVSHGPMELEFSSTGVVREMHPVVRDEIYRIACEAIRNACMHSDGGRLEVEVLYGRCLSLRIRDNGIGMDRGLADKGREGHFGLQGMRERATRIGAAFTLVSSVATGTEITISVPANVVFLKPHEIAVKDIF
jgi:signal transduction histidine kinase/ligand-binding sensor domain-containing protein